MNSSQDYSALIGELRQRLEALQRAIAIGNEIGIGIGIELTPNSIKDWQRSHEQLQTFFQSQIVNASIEVTSQNLSLQVEIDKHLKMLGVDLAMLQTARSPNIWQKRHQQVCDCLTRLKRYCEM